MATQILMPALSPTMEEGKLAKWLVKEGDTVKSGDILAEIETDKATMEFEAVDEGKIGKILVAEGTEGVKVNAPIAELARRRRSRAPPRHLLRDAARSRIRGSAEAKPEILLKGLASKPSVAAPKPAAPEPAPVKPAPKPEETHRVFASPLARRIAEQKGVDIANVKGSGPRGRIVKADVEAAKPGAKAPAAPAAEARRSPPLRLHRRHRAAARCAGCSTSRTTTTRSRTTRCARRSPGG